MPKSDDILRLAARYRQASGAPVASDSVYDFAMKHRRIERRPFTLERYKPLQALYEDDWPLIDVMKPAQRGVSEWAISLVCYALDQGARRWVPDGSKAGLNVGYVFPARGDLIEFSKERLSGLKEESTYLAEMFGTDDDRFDSLAFKQVRDSFLYLRGGYSTTGLRSFPCDVLILDEYDELDPGAVALARRRLNASLVKRLVRISTPTIPGRGISAAFASSDQRMYETPCGYCATQCSHCGEPMDAPRGTPHGKCGGFASTWNQYDFFRDVWCDGQPWDEWQKWTPPHVEMAEVELRCPNCGRAQTPQDRTTPGRWVSEAPQMGRIHGYHVPWWPWPEPMMELQQLALNAISDDPSEIEQFYRSDLGVPHGAAGGQITAEMLLQLASELQDGNLPDGPWRDTVMGADIGARIHYRIDSIGPGGFVYVREMGSVPRFENLDELMRKFNVRRAVVDAEPEWHAALDFCGRWKGRALRCFYPTQASALKSELFHLKDGTPDIQANRTMILDLVYATVSAGSERWPTKIAADEEVVSHMTNMTRVRVSDEDTGNSHYNWVRTGPDHGAHACFEAGTQVLTADGERNIEDVRTGDLVATRQGFKRVLAAGATGIATVQSFEMPNGRTLWATPNHPVFTANRGWIPLHALTYGDILLEWHDGRFQSRSSSTKPSRFGGIQTRCVAQIGCTSRLAAWIASEGSSACIRRFGKTSTARFLRGIMSTTATRIPLTMRRAIWSACHWRSTPVSTAPNGTRRTHKSFDNCWMSFVLCRTPGVGHQRDTRGIASTARKCSVISSHGSTSAITAAKTSSVPQREKRAWSIAHQLVALPIAASLAWMMSIQLASYAARSSAETSTRRAGTVRSAARVRSPWRKDTVVYNLSVEGAEEYVANGVLVHNCAYALLARKTLPVNQSFAPAVSGGRQVVDDFKRVAAMNLGRAAVARGIPSWVPPAVK